MQKCLDNYNTTFASFPMMLDYHQTQSESSQWVRCPVKDLSVESLGRMSPNHLNPSAFAVGVGEEAISDTTEHLGLALKVKGELYPVRETAYKTLLDRAKIGGSILPKLSRETLAGVLNECLHLSSTDALVLIRDEKISAVHSGDETDYSILEIDSLLRKLTEKLDARFPGSEFEQGYADHSIASGLWKLSGQRESLIGAYIKTLSAYNDKAKLDKIVPGVRFITSDTGVASAKVSALLLGGAYPIHIGGCIAVDHRHKTSIEDFDKALDQLFAQFRDSIKKLERLLEVYLNYPVNAMTRVCKKLSLPKKAALEAIDMFEKTYGGGIATAHDVFMAMQEILYTLKCEGAPQSKMLTLEENMARALTLDWTSFDLAKAVDY